MEEILSDYHVNLATWFYLSLLLTIAVFFRFGRVWSLRNLDLVLLLSLSPGLLFVDVENQPATTAENQPATTAENQPAAAVEKQTAEGAEKQTPIGYIWLFVVSGLLLLRLFCDGLFQRRPPLEQNLNRPGLAVLGLAAFVFLMTKAITEPPPHATVETARKAKQLLTRQDVSSGSSAGLSEADQSGPAAPMLIGAAAVALPTAMAAANGTASNEQNIVEIIAPRIMAILCHLAVIAGLIVLGRFHFGELQLGLAMATLYLLLPCTAYDVGKVNHVLPAALILWAFVAYRRPMVAGGLMGLACGTVFFPIFLLPLWAAFYDRRGALRFGFALLIVAAVLSGSLVLTSADAHSFTRQVIGSIDWSVLQFREVHAAGFWKMHDPAYRIPVFASFLVMLVVLTVWPRRKTLEHLMSHSTAIVLATQFWYPQQGGVYLLWYLPLLLLVVFRPRLVHHVSQPVERSADVSRRAPEPVSQQLATTGAVVGHLFR